MLSTSTFGSAFSSNEARAAASSRGSRVRRGQPTRSTVSDDFTGGITQVLVANGHADGFSRTVAYGVTLSWVKIIVVTVGIITTSIIKYYISLAVFFFGTDNTRSNGSSSNGGDGSRGLLWVGLQLFAASGTSAPKKAYPKTIVNGCLARACGRCHVPFYLASCHCHSAVLLACTI